MMRPIVKLGLLGAGALGAGALVRPLKWDAAHPNSEAGGFPAVFAKLTRQEMARKGPRRPAWA